MIKNKIILELSVNDRVYQLQCDPESPLGEIHDALCKFRGCIIEKMIEAEKKDSGGNNACSTC